MEFKLISDTEIVYTGDQLRSHWIYEEFDLLGDAMVAFIGECNVTLNRMLDIEDIKACSPIYSTKMLHFIIEHFGSSIKEIVLQQRLFICIIQNYLNNMLKTREIIRKGDDLYFNGLKLSVSIATVSQLSGLIHVGLNIDSKNAPVKAAGLLSEMNIDNINDLAIQLMTGYTYEQQQIKKAIYKVKSVN